MASVPKKVSKLIIDAHTHILPRNWPDMNKRFGYEGFVSFGDFEDSVDTVDMLLHQKLFRKVKRNCFDTPERRNDMDQDTVHVQVLCTVPVMFSYWAKPQDTAVVARELNENLAATIAKHPKRYVGLGTLPMNDPTLAIQELEYCIQELGFSGIQIGSHINEKTLGDASLFPVFERCSELNAAVLVHPWGKIEGYTKLTGSRYDGE